MVATVRHVTSSSGLRKFQTDGFLSDNPRNTILTKYVHADRNAAFDCFPLRFWVVLTGTNSIPSSQCDSLVCFGVSSRLHGQLLTDLHTFLSWRRANVQKIRILHQT
jgi:hypothetical protein